MINNIMKNIFIAVILSTASLVAYSANFVMPIVSVTDGDTIRSSVKLPCPLCNVSVRILGIDTPESTNLAQCPAEKAKGLEAKAFLKAFAAPYDTMTVSDYKWDKYGGRIDAVVIINNINVGQLLIEKGFAKPYTGSGPKPNWCN